MIYRIHLYAGYDIMKGVNRAEFRVENASSAKDAIEKLCPSLSTDFFRSIDELKGDEDEFIVYCKRNPDEYMYVDSTKYGGKRGYLHSAHMIIEEVLSNDSWNMFLNRE